MQGRGASGGGGGDAEGVHATALRPYTTPARGAPHPALLVLPHSRWCFDAVGVCCTRTVFPHRSECRQGFVKESSVEVQPGLVWCDDAVDDAIDNRVDDAIDDAVDDVVDD